MRRVGDSDPSPVAVVVAAAGARVSTSWRVVCVAATVRAVSLGHIDEVVVLD